MLVDNVVPLMNTLFTIEAQFQQLSIDINFDAIDGM